MKISKYRDIDDSEERDHKKQVEQKLDQLVDINTSKLDSIIDTNSEIKNQNTELKYIEESNLDQLNDINTKLQGLQPRSESTKIYNKKIEEDIIILESTDELFKPEQPCIGMFEYNPNYTEANQFFLLEESVNEDRCQERIYNFDKDQPFAIRLDSYEGDEHGFFNAPGLSNNSSDILIKNDTLWDVRVRTDNRIDNYTVGDGFSLVLNDIEKDEPVLVKRDNTISGYMLTFIVEGKANS